MAGVQFPSGQDLSNRIVHPTQEDLRVLYFIAGYTVAIFILWNFPVLKHLLHPFKLVVTALHEFGHALMGKCTGAKIKSITIDADTGGLTKMRGGNPYCTLPAGYIGSSFFGGLMVFAGFSVLASKVVGALIGVCFLATLYWAKNWIARILPILYVGLIALLWWWEQSIYLPYFVLFLGVMCSLQSLWDFQGLILHENPESDPSKFAELCGCCPPQFWALLWCLLSLVFMAGFILLGMITFHN